MHFPILYLVYQFYIDVFTYFVGNLSNCKSKYFSKLQSTQWSGQRSPKTANRRERTVSQWNALTDKEFPSHKNYHLKQEINSEECWNVEGFKEDLSYIKYYRVKVDLDNSYKLKVQFINPILLKTELKLRELRTPSKVKQMLKDKAGIFTIYKTD